MSDYSKAMEDYEKAVAMDPKNPVYINRRGYTYALLNDYTQAVKDYTKAIELEPKYEEAYSNRALLI
jgi:tetratricopeptide (TPR) repeat protein